MNSATGFNFYNRIDSVILADFNGSGTVTGADTTLLQGRILTPAGTARLPVVPAYESDPLAAPMMLTLSTDDTKVTETIQPTLLITTVSDPLPTASTDVYTAGAATGTTGATLTPIDTTIDSTTSTKKEKESKVETLSSALVSVPVSNVFSNKKIRR